MKDYEERIDRLEKKLKRLQWECIFLWIVAGLTAFNVLAIFLR